MDIDNRKGSIVMALEHFEVYIGSSSVPVIVYTDHNPLFFLDKMHNTNIDELEFACVGFQCGCRTYPWQG